MSVVTRRHWIVTDFWLDTKMQTCELRGRVWKGVMNTAVNERKSFTVLSTS